MLIIQSLPWPVSYVIVLFIQLQKKTEERDNRIQQWEDFKLVSKSRSSKPKVSTDTLLKFGVLFSFWCPKVKPDQGRYFPLGGGGLGENYRPQSRARKWSFCDNYLFCYEVGAELYAVTIHTILFH